MTPTIDSLATAFNTTPMTTILFANTITGVVSVVVSILIGLVANKIGFKRVSIIGILIVIIGGTYPFLMSVDQGYGLVILSRILVGVGLGVLNPLANALVISWYPGKNQSLILGIGNIFFFGAGTIYQIIAGQFAAIGWNYSFLTYAIGIIPLILMAVCLPEPRKDERTEEEKLAEKAQAKSEKMPAIAWLFVIAAFAVVMFDMPLVFQSSTLLSEGGMGDAGVAGIVASVFTAGGCVAGLIFAGMKKLFKNFLFSVFPILCAIGCFLGYFATNAAVMGVGMTILGIGHLGFFIACSQAAGNVVPKSKLALVSGLMMSAMNFATFVATYFMTAVGSALPNLGLGGPVLVDAILLIIVAVIMFFAVGIRKLKV